MRLKTKPTKGAKGVICFIGALAFYLLLVDYVDVRRDGGGHRQLRNLDSDELALTERPVMYTFFEPVAGGCCGMTEQGHYDLLNAWEDAWQDFGWNTKVLTVHDARTHPYFKSFRNKLLDLGINDYDQRCFWRWLAMANQPYGGWSSDYDNFPLSLTAEQGLELQKGGGFKSFGQHVPALMYADKRAWNQMIKLMMDTISPDLNLEVFSDMHLFLHLHSNLSEEEMGITNWSNEMYPGFPYLSGTEDVDPQFNCKWIKRHLTAHLSHRGSMKAFKHGKYPRIEGMTVTETAEKRAEAARLMLSHLKECGPQKYQSLDKPNIISLPRCVTLSCIKSSYPSQIDWKNIFKGQPTQGLPVPRILHHVILGDNAPPSMIKLVEWNFHNIRPNGYETKLWRDSHVEELIEAYGPSVRRMWEYAKADQSGGGPARLKDIACILILFAVGGVHFDADTVLCNKQVDFMVDKPGVVSFPFQLHNGNQVTPAAVSAPPGHRLMGSAMEFFINLGPKISGDEILGLTGPRAFAKVVDEYIKEVGIVRPPISQGNSVYGPENPSGLPSKIPVPRSVWAAEIADLRFTNGNTRPETGFWHMGFGTWFEAYHEPTVRPCDEDVDLVFPWLDAFCADPQLRNSEGCFGNTWG